MSTVFAVAGTLTLLAAFGWAALLRRERTGSGEYIDISMLDVQVAMLGYQGSAYLASGKVPGLQGRTHDSYALAYCVKAKDGVDVMIAANSQRAFEALARDLVDGYFHGVSILDVTSQRLDDVYVVTAKAADRTGRTDAATGAVAIGNLKGEALANALMKAARDKGARLIQGCAVTGVRVEHNRVTGVETTQGTFFAPIVVNAAGGYSGAHPELRPADSAWFATAMDNLLNTLINVCDACWPHLEARGGGSVINIGAAPLTRLVGTPASGESSWTGTC